MKKNKEKDIVIGLLQDIADKINGNILHKEPSKCGDISFCDKNDTNFIVVDDLVYDGAVNDYYAIICSSSEHFPVYFQVKNNKINDYQTTAKDDKTLECILKQTLQCINFG